MEPPQKRDLMGRSMTPIGTKFGQEDCLNELQPPGLAVDSRPDTGGHGLPEKRTDHDDSDGDPDDSDQVVDHKVDKVSGPALSEHPLGSESEPPLQRDEYGSQHH